MTVPLSAVLKVYRLDRFLCYLISPTIIYSHSTSSPWLVLCVQMLEELMAVVGLSTKASLVLRFKQLLSASWSQNGDSLSILYAGTRALQGKISVRVCVCVCVCGYIQWNLCISDNLVLSIIIIIEKCPLFEGVLYSSIGKCIFGAPNLVRPLFGVSFSGSSTVAI